MTQSLLDKKIIALCLLCIPSWMTAQRGLNKKQQWERAHQTQGWLQSSNRAGLYQVDSLQRIGFAQAEGAYQTDQYSLGVVSKAYQRLSHRAMLYGEAAYKHERQQNQTGSLWYQARKKPFDLVSQENDNLGNYQTECYHLAGALSYQLIQHLALGMEMDYTAANHTRQKDLRHKNQVVDMQTGVGLFSHLGRGWNIGINYRYHRYIESLATSIEGTTDKQYHTLISFGSFWGRQELFGDEGVTGARQTKPWVDQKHQIGLQLSKKIGPRGELFQELIVGKADGYYGDNSSNSLVYFEHDQRIWSEKIGLTYQGKQLHTLQLYAQGNTVTNRENIWESHTTENGTIHYELQGQNVVGKKNHLSLATQYEMTWQNKEGAPTWWMLYNGLYHEQEVVGILFPYYQERELAMMWHQVALGKAFYLGKWQLDIQAGVGMRLGVKATLQEGVYTPPSSDKGKPVINAAMLQQQTDWWSQDRVISEIKLSANYQHKTTLYTFNIKANTLYTEASFGVYF